MCFVFRAGAGLASMLGMVLVSTSIAVSSSAARARADVHESWSKTESAAETREYGQQLKEGKFDAPQRAYLSNAILPQLALPANRPVIGQVRQRIRDIAAAGATQPQIIEESNALARDFMVRVARDVNADPLVRVNAMMLVGELQGGDRRPWKGAVESLSQAAGDGKLPLEVRIAALAALSRHAAAGDDSFAAQVGPALATIVSTPPQGDTVATTWLLARAVELLPLAEPSPAVLQAIARLAADDQASLDLRVRAAAAFAKAAKRVGETDPVFMLKVIRSLGVLGLERDLNAAEDRRFRRRLATGGVQAEGGFGGSSPAVEGRLPGEGLFGGFAGESGLIAPVDEDAVPVLACRRNAWRLAMLADAVRPESGSGGIAALLEGDAAAAAIDLASVLRLQSRDILAHPHEDTIKEALEALKKAGPAGPAAKTGGQGDPPGATSPFDDPAAQ